MLYTKYMYLHVAPPSNSTLVLHYTVYPSLLLFLPPFHYMHSPLPALAVAEELARDGVRDYLRFHRDFLEEFILQEMPQETLERILIRKTLKTSMHTDEGAYKHVFPLYDID